MSVYDDFERKFKEEGAKLKVLEITQGTLWLKQAGLHSDKLKEIREKTPLISEGFLNQMMQLAYNEGSKAIEKTSYDAGWAACRKDMMKRLDVEEDDNDGYF